MNPAGRVRTRGDVVALNHAQPESSTGRKRVIYHRDEILTVGELANALGVSIRTIERADLPTIYFGRRTRRYLWGQILDVLEKRAQ